MQGERFFHRHASNNHDHQDAWHGHEYDHRGARNDDYRNHHSRHHDYLDYGRLGQPILRAASKRYAA